MIIDCCTFFNELDLLEVRLHTLAPYVDAFVVVEADRTFQGARKEPTFRDAQFEERFRVGKPVFTTCACLCDGNENYRQAPFRSAWDREAHQRRAIINTVDHALRRMEYRGPRDEVRIILSDVDEIPDLNGFADALDDDDNAVNAAIAWKQTLFYYWVNLKCWEWTGSVSCSLKTLREQFHNDLQYLRNRRHEIVRRAYMDGGWHFSFLGGAEAIREKILSFSHTEYIKCSTPENISHALTKGWKENRDVFGREFLKFELMPDDSHLPPYMVENKERFADWWYRQ